MKRVIALLAVFSAPAHAEGWKSIATNASGVEYLIREQDSLAPSGPTPLIWVKTDNRGEAGRRWASSLSQIQFDCAGQTLRLVATYAYDEQGKTQDAQTVTPEQQRTIRIPAGSVWALVARMACPR